MTNFKSGSGNLDFDGDDDPAADSSEPTPPGDSDLEQGASAADPPAKPDSDTGSDATEGGRSPGESDGETYPYFVRRSNVGDERDTRLEVHVRDKVAEGEAQYRHALATQLDTSDVSKTDAREFALLAAYRHPERVAELMREEGFDSLG